MKAYREEEMENTGREPRCHGEPSTYHHVDAAVTHDRQIALQTSCQAMSSMKHFELLCFVSSLCSALRLRLVVSGHESLFNLCPFGNSSLAFTGLLSLGALKQFAFPLRGYTANDGSMVRFPSLIITQNTTDSAAAAISAGVGGVVDVAVGGEAGFPGGDGVTNVVPVEGGAFTDRRVDGCTEVWGVVDGLGSSLTIC